MSADYHKKYNLTINPYRLRYIRQDSGNFDLNELLEKIDELSQLDIAIKT